MKAHYLLATGLSHVEKLDEAEREYAVAAELAAAPENAPYRTSIQQVALGGFGAQRLDIF